MCCSCCTALSAVRRSTCSVLKRISCRRQTRLTAGVVSCVSTAASAMDRTMYDTLSLSLCLLACQLREFYHFQGWLWIVISVGFCQQSLFIRVPTGQGKLEKVRVFEWSWKGQGKIFFLEKSGKMKNLCHQMSDFQGKMRHIWFLSGLHPRAQCGGLQHSPRLSSCGVALNIAL